MDINQFNKWNPGFDKALAEGKKYPLRLQKDKTAVFNARKNNFLMESLRALLDGNVSSPE
jgi:membrane-bound lytic murein transglycosylase D